MCILSETTGVDSAYGPWSLSNGRASTALEAMRIWWFDIRYEGMAGVRPRPVLQPEVEDVIQAQGQVRLVAWFSCSESSVSPGP